VQGTGTQDTKKSMTPSVASGKPQSDTTELTEMPAAAHQLLLNPVRATSPLQSTSAPAATSREHCQRSTTTAEVASTPEGVTPKDGPHAKPHEETEEKARAADTRVSWPSEQEREPAEQAESPQRGLGWLQAWVLHQKRRATCTWGSSVGSVGATCELKKVDTGTREAPDPGGDKGQGGEGAEGITSPPPSPRPSGRVPWEPAKLASAPSYLVV
jgi:hypothetical protein